MSNTELENYAINSEGDVQPTAYEVAKAHWHQVVAKRRQLEAKLDGARVSGAFSSRCALPAELVKVAGWCPACCCERRRCR